jgi:hypothetical protein
LVLLFGCANARSGDPGPSTDTASFPVGSPEVVVAEPATAGAAAVDLEATPAARWLDSPALALATVTPATAAAATPPRFALREDDSRDNYLTAKAGEIYPTDSNLSAGWIVGAAYGQYFTRLFSVELAASYFEPGNNLTPSTDMYAVPLMANVRVSLPIWLLQVYGGVGLGAFYYDIDGGALKGDGWLGAGNAFVGADITVFDRLSAGLELKYFVTDQIRNSNINFDGLALAVTLGLRF